MSNINKDWIKKVMDRLSNLESRVSSLEKLMPTIKETRVVTKEFKGLSGGINKLIDEGFFSRPKSLSQILDEMRRQNYYYSAPAVNTALTRDFMKRKGLLTRLGKRGEWKYVLRK